MSVEALNSLIESDDGRFGAYTPKGDAVVFRIMKSLVKKLVKLEEQTEKFRSPSVAERLLAAEKAMAKYSDACEKHSDEGLSDTDVREQVGLFMVEILEASGLSKGLIREFFYEAF